MKERVCKNCGGRDYKIVGQNMLKCSFCGTIYVDEEASKEEAVLLVGANEFLREARFDDALREFDKILSLFEMSFAGFYGKTLAKNKIIIYNSGKTIKTPRFFDEPKPLFGDEDFERAVELAPSETKKQYVDIARKVDKSVANYQKFDGNFDVFLCDSAFDKTNPDAETMAIYKALQEKGYKIYFPQNLTHREKEAESFKALKTAKVFLYISRDAKSFYLGDTKSFYDRYFYFVSQRQKARTSFVLLYDSVKTPKQTLPKELVASRNSVKLDDISFLQDVCTKVSEEIKNSEFESAKLEQIKVERVDPAKKEYVEIDSIQPQELGSYKIENIEAGEENKIKWIFLSLKNGDFASAKELAEKELLTDPNNAELLFALLLCEKQITTRDMFFENIKNFDNKEKIDRILTYANKQFAEYFVDNWEKLLEKLNSVDYFNKYLLYLAKFNTPNRENFVTCAQNLAVESLNDELIEKVLRCFGQTEVDKFVQMYFMLAQKSDNHEYYNKILSLDQGHEQSQIAIFLDHFKTDEDKLSYRNKEEVERVFSYLSDATRDAFICQILELVTGVAFKDLLRAQKQIDFYLAYMSSGLNGALEKLATRFQDMAFFKVAEKYLAIAISKDPQNADLYWQILKVKAHCITDNDVILSPVKISKLDEWENLLAVANEEQSEKYAQIISKSNLYTGDKEPFVDDNPDLENLKSKLEAFLLRNGQILLDFEKENQYSGAISYYRAQINPFYSYSDSLANVNTFDEYCEVLNKVKNRLDALDLSLDSSINVTKLQEKSIGKFNSTGTNSQSKTETKVGSNESTKNRKSLKDDKFLKTYLFVFLELFPLALSLSIFISLICSPKLVYMAFSQTFLVSMLTVCVIIGVFNIVLFARNRQSKNFLWRTKTSLLICFALINAVLFLVGNYLTSGTIEINSEAEMVLLMKNANASNLKLTKNIEITSNWEAHNFSGTLDGAGFEIKIKFADEKEVGFVKKNSGKISNLKLVIVSSNLKKVKSFGAIAVENIGTIENCEVSGNVSISSDDCQKVGGICATNSSKIEKVSQNIRFDISTKSNDFVFGGISATNSSSGKISKSSTNSTVNLNLSSKNFTFGGAVGQLARADESRISQVGTIFSLSANGSSQNSLIGGLVGEGFSFANDCFARGAFDLQNLSSNGLVGGLYGEYLNSSLNQIVKTSYSDFSITSNSTLLVGGLVGGLGGKFENCFSTFDGALFGKSHSAYYEELTNCFTSDDLSQGYYDDRLGFDFEIWQILTTDYPRLKSI